MQTYTAFGLSFNAPFPCPELNAAAVPIDEPDVTVEPDDVPSSLPSPSHSSPFFQRDARRLLMNIPGVASYLVEEGKRIGIAAHVSSAPETVRLFLFDTILAALLQQRGIAPLLGFSIAHGNGAVLVLKVRGMIGASTLAAVLRRRGRQLLADGYAAVGLSPSGGACALPGLRCQYLWKDAIDAWALDEHSLTCVTPGLNLYRVDVAAECCNLSLPISRVYVLHEGARLSAEPIESVNRRAHLLWQTAYHPFLSEWSPLTVARTLATQVEVYILFARSQEWNPFDVADALEAHLEP